MKLLGLESNRDTRNPKFRGRSLISLINSPFSSSFLYLNYWRNDICYIGECEVNEVEIK